MCLLGQPSIQPTPAGKTLVVNPKKCSTARHLWGTQRQETQVRRLSSPPTQPAASHTTLRFISGKRKHDHIFLSALFCPPVLTAPTQTFHRILAQKCALGGSGFCERVVFFFFNLGEELVLVEKQVRVVLVYRPIVLAEQTPSWYAGAVGRGCHPAPVDNIYLSRMFRSMVCVYFTELIPRALLLFVHGSVPKSCPTLETPCTVARQASLSLGILQARILEWVAISFSRRSAQPRNRTQVSCIAGRFFTD